MNYKLTLRLLYFVLLLFSASLLSFAQVPNDECLDAISLMVNTDLACGIITVGTNEGATASPEIDDVIGTPDDDVWFSFTATSIRHKVTLTNVNIVSGCCSTGMAIGLYTGTCGALILFDDTDDYSTTFAGLVIGNTYLLRVYNTRSKNSFLYSEVTFDICIGIPPPPPINDDCLNAITLLESAYDCTNTLSGNTIEATQSGESLCSSYSNDDDVWFSFTPSHTDLYYFKINNTITSTVAIYSGTCAGGLNLIECSTIVSSANLIAGVNYLVQVYSNTVSFETFFDLCAFRDPFPLMVDCSTGLTDTHCYGNDDPSTWSYSSADGVSLLRFEFTAGGIGNGFISIYDGLDNTAPRLYFGNNNGDLTGLSFISTGPHLFFEIIAAGGSTNCRFNHSCCVNDPWEWQVNCLPCIPAAATAEIASCNQMNSTFTIDLNVTNLGDGTIIVSNDIGAPSTTISTTGITNLGPFNFSPSLNLTLEHPTEAICDVLLPEIISDPCFISNNECSSAIVINESPNPLCQNFMLGSTLNATSSQESGICFTGKEDNDIWYKFTPMQTTDYRFKFRDLGVLINVYTGNCNGGLVVEDCRNWINIKSLSAGTTYFLQLYTPMPAPETNFNFCIYPFTCPSVNSLQAVNATGSTIDISWTPDGTESAWDIEVVVAGTSPTGVATYNDVATIPYTVTGLNQGAFYDIYVRADCGMDDSDFSEWEKITASISCPDDFAGGGMLSSQPPLTGLLTESAIYETDGRIISSQSFASPYLFSGIDVEYNSGSDILLEVGFEVKLGDELSAFIEGCN